HPARRAGRVAGVRPPQDRRIAALASRRYRARLRPHDSTVTLLEYPGRPHLQAGTCPRHETLRDQPVKHLLDDVAMRAKNDIAALEPCYQMNDSLAARSLLEVTARLAAPLASVRQWPARLDAAPVRAG